MKRALGVAALLLGVVAMSVGSAGLAVAQGAGNKGGKSGAPLGNNGTIKIDQTPLDLVSGGKVDHANHPHVSCDFALSFFGFDTGTQTAQVNFTAQPPSGKFQLVAALVSPTNFTFTGHGPGGSLDTSKPYQLDVTGLKANPNQGFHIKVEVEVTGSQGADDKFKVFWYQPCQTPTTTSTTLKHHGTTTTSTTLKHEGTTTTSTTLKHHGTTTTSSTSTTSTTLTPTSSSVPEKGTTTVPTTAPPTTAPPTTAPPTTAPPTTSPPTTSKGHGNVTGTTTTTTAAPAPATGQTPSGLAFTSGPTPSGAGTDIGFFSTHEWIGSSDSPWLLLIAGGVLLAGAGGLSLKGSRLKRWMTRA